MEYLLNKWRETGRIAYRRPNKKLISLNGGPNIPEKQALDKIKDFFDKQSEMDEADIQRVKYDVVIAKLKDGIWDTSYDVKPRTHLEVTVNKTKKIMTIFVEESLQEAVSESRDNFDVDKMLDDAAKLKKDFPMLRKGQSIMITLRDMNPTLYKKAAARYNVFYVDEKIPELITFLDPTKFLDPKYRVGNDEIYEAININDYNATSEKSQFGGYRPKVVHKDGSMMYLSAASYNTPDEAKDHAEDYLKQYARGIREPRVPIKGTYGLKEEKESYDSWIIKPRDGGDGVKVQAPDETSAIEIALGRKPSQNEIDFFNFHYILIHEKTNVSTLRNMKIVELATKCYDSDLVKEYVEQHYKPKTSALEIKESFRSFVSNKTIL